MNFALMIHTLLIVHQAVFFVLLGLFMIMSMAFIFRSKILGQIVVNLEKFIFGFFGLFRCLSRPQHYSYLGIEVKSKLGTAICFSIGIWILCLHVAFFLSLLAIGVADWYILSAPLILYLAYPAILYALRKNCA